MCFFLHIKILRYIFATSKDKECLQASLGFRFGTLNTGNKNH